MRTFSLFDKIAELLVQKRHVFVAISGFGGSGKSHLADQLCDHFEISQGQVVRLDHLYSQTPNGPGVLDQVDWLLLTQILEEAHAGQRLCYLGRGFRGEVISVDEELPRLLIVEGIRLLQPRLLCYFDITVWINTPQAVAMERAKARDRAQGEDEERVSLWDTDWGPKDRDYFESYRPDQLATFLY